MTLTHMQHINTMKNDSSQPAVPTTHANLTNRMIPNMFWIQGKNTPIIVPSFRFCTAQIWTQNYTG